MTHLIPLSEKAARRVRFERRKRKHPRDSRRRGYEPHPVGAEVDPVEAQQVEPLAFASVEAGEVVAVA